MVRNEGRAACIEIRGPQVIDDTKDLGPLRRSEACTAQSKPSSPSTNELAADSFGVTSHRHHRLPLVLGRIEHGIDRRPGWPTHHGTLVGSPIDSVPWHTRIICPDLMIEPVGDGSDQAINKTTRSGSRSPRNSPDQATSIVPIFGEDSALINDPERL